MRLPLASRAESKKAEFEADLCKRVRPQKTTAYAKLGPERLVRRWTSDPAQGTKGPVVELYRLN